MVSSISSTYTAATPAAQPAATDVADRAKAGAAAYAKAEDGASTSKASVQVTLSEHAKAATSPSADTRPTAAVVLYGRAELDSRLKAANVTSALKDGKATIDLSGLDRRTLWAIAAGLENRFTTEERVVATLELNKGRDKALAGPAAAARVKGDYAGLYRTALARLDAAGPEEKASGQWSRDRAAVIKGLDAAIARPGVAPVIEGDPVAAYLKEVGGVVASPRTREIGGIVADVRAVLDAQYAASDGGADADRGEIDFSRFDSRSLSAVALNKGGAFSRHEVALAASEMKSRNWADVSSDFDRAKSQGDVSAFGRNILERYSAMSEEERQAAGWDQTFYDRLVSVQGMSERVAKIFEDRGGPTLLDYL
ncbi:MAG: hypothetical protein EON90_06290 [Brevundimonas sp.]|nr:MAG: hypothetical protein EON90_06290 [Brevundimonas sp.]